MKLIGMDVGSTTVKAVAVEWRAAAEGEHVEAVAGAEDGVRLGPGAVQDAVAGAHGVGAPVLPADALAVQDVEQLLLVGVHVRRHGALARGEPEAAQPDVRSAGRGPQAPARSAQLRTLDDTRPDLVAVGDHPAAMLVIPPT